MHLSVNLIQVLPHQFSLTEGLAFVQLSWIVSWLRRPKCILRLPAITFRFGRSVADQLQVTKEKSYIREDTGKISYRQKKLGRKGWLELGKSRAQPFKMKPSITPNRRSNDCLFFIFFDFVLPFSVNLIFCSSSTMSLSSFSSLLRLFLFLLPVYLTSSTTTIKK